MKSHCSYGHKYETLTNLPTELPPYDEGYAVCNGCCRDILAGEKFLHCKCNEDYCSKCLYDDRQLVIKDQDIYELRDNAPKSLFPLLDYVERSKIKEAADLRYSESFFALGNKSELSKCLTRNIWNEYKDV